MVPTASLWDIQESAFRAAHTPAERLYFLLNYAVLAPSVHNTQPWRFQITDNVVDLYADRTRTLEATDPSGRERTISCGAALLYLRIAIRYFGFTATVQPFPDPAMPHLLARVTLGHRWPPKPRPWPCWARAPPPPPPGWRRARHAPACCCTSPPPGWPSRS
jgi:nitroreductase